jgi:SAM-dependent methyltransferase
VQEELFEYYLSERYALKISSAVEKEIIEGVLKPADGTQPIQIRNGIPRFVDGQGYASNFGLQWNAFRLTQLDSHTGLPLTFNRFWNNTKWKPRELNGSRVLEAGCGAGRFTEIMLDAGCEVVSFDLSGAVDANWQTNREKGQLLVMQADIYDLPLRSNAFDLVFCYGVLQHTPEPERAYQELWKRVRPGGKISIDFYIKFPYPSPWSTPKYLWRPVTTRMEPDRLLRIVRTYVPFWLPFDTFIKRIPFLGSVLGGLTCIPLWNYYNLPLSPAQKREWAIMDTFDALGARYDSPKTLEEVRAMVTLPDAEKIEVFKGSNGVVANVTKKG